MNITVLKYSEIMMLLLIDMVITITKTTSKKKQDFSFQIGSSPTHVAAICRGNPRVFFEVVPLLCSAVGESMSSLTMVTDICCDILEEEDTVRVIGFGGKTVLTFKEDPTPLETVDDLLKMLVKTSSGREIVGLRPDFNYLADVLMQTVTNPRDFRSRLRHAKVGS